MTVQVEPHEFEQRKGLWNRIRGICNRCYGPKSIHPRRTWVRGRPIGDDRYIDDTAPHFEEGW